MGPNFLNSLHFYITLVINAQRFEYIFLLLSTAEHLIYLCRDVQKCLIFENLTLAKYSEFPIGLQTVI